MEQSFGKTVSGALKLKGLDLSKSKAKKQKKKKSKKISQAANDELSKDLNAGSKRAREEPSDESSHTGGEIIGPKVFEGSGLITVTGTIVTGTDTKFTSELHLGDAIRLTIAPVAPAKTPIALHAGSASVGASSHAAPDLSEQASANEIRVVKHIFSDAQLKIGSPFPGTHTEPEAYTCMTLPRKAVTEADRRAREKRRRLAEERASAGTYGGGGGRVLTYREKKAGTSHGSYRIVTKVLDAETTRESLLDLRSKQKSDRYCMQ